MQRISIATTVLLTLAATSALARTDVIALSGDAAPQVADTTFSQFNLPTLNGLGHVAFIGELAGGGVTSSTRYGIWLSGDTGLDLLVRRGDPIGDTGDVINVPWSQPSRPQIALNDADTVAFNAGDRLATVDASGLTVVVTKGDSAPGTSGVFYGLTSDPPLLGQNGEITFLGFFSPSTNGYNAGLWSTASGSLTPIAIEGQQAAGLPAGSVYTSLASLGTLTRSGLFAFVGQAGPSGATLGRFWVQRPDTGFELYMSNGDAIPGFNAANTGAGWTAHNDAGVVAFYTQFIFNNGSRKIALLTDAGGTVAPVFLEGDVAPGAPGGLRFASSLSYPKLNGGGQIAFANYLLLSSPGGLSGSGVWRYTPGVGLEKIAVTGDPAPEDPSQSFALVDSHIQFNDAGVVAFQARTTTQATGDNLYLGDGIETLRVTAVGDVIAGRTIGEIEFLADSNGCDGLPAAFNNFGQIAYRVTFADSSQGVELFTPDLHWRDTAGDGQWDSAANWTLSIDPAHVHDVFLDADAPTTITGPLNATVRSLTIGGGAAETTLRVRPSITGSTVIDIVNGLSLIGNGRLAGDGKISGDVAQTGGLLAAGSELPSTTPTTRTGFLRVDGDYTITGGAVEVQIYPGYNGIIYFDRYEVLGKASLGGQLMVSLLWPNSIELGATLTFLSTTNPDSIAGQFDSAVLPVFDGRTFDLLYDDDSVALHVIPLLAGDANNDGVVDAADYLAVEQHFGEVGVSNGSLTGDANDDGRVDGADVIFIERHFGATWSAPVPEPATALAILAGLAVLRTPRRRARCNVQEVSRCGV